MPQSPETQDGSCESELPELQETTRAEEGEEFRGPSRPSRVDGGQKPLTTNPPLNCLGGLELKHLWGGGGVDEECITPTIGQAPPRNQRRCTCGFKLTASISKFRGALMPFSSLYYDATYFSFIEIKTPKPGL